MLIVISQQCFVVEDQEQIIVATFKELVGTLIEIEEQNTVVDLVMHLVVTTSVWRLIPVENV